MFPLALLLLASPRAEVPMPVFPECGEPYRPDLCPADLEEDWWLISYIPEVSLETVRPAELELGSGVWADRAWRTTTGRWDTVIAVTDSGIEWENVHVVNKVLLNVGELPVPEDADGNPFPDHDADGNGLVNIQDYAEDPRVDPTMGRDVADDLLDPSDLIAAFSDGVDDDGNGFADDIAGWDFYEGDNDPWNTYDTGYGNHGTGVMEEAAAEGADDYGEIGACPSCAVLPVRIGETFIVDGARAAAGVAYAVDRGASVIAMAVGAMHTPPALRDALRYARDRGVLVVGAAGDENAYHRNYPAALDEVLFVHSIRPDGADDDGPATSYMNTWNCNNYGPRMDLVASSTACATGSVAIVSGVAGLVFSAAADLGRPLTARQVRQVLRDTVDDVWLTEEERQISGAYPSSEGWDPFYGYGRVNAAHAVEAVLEDRIPPEAVLGGPAWFETIDPARRPTVPVEVYALARDGGAVHWSVEIGRGWEPTSFEEVASGDGTGELETAFDLDIQGFGAVTVPEPDRYETLLERVERTHLPAVTLRLRVTDEDGLVGEDRRVFHVVHDPWLKEGFPVDLGASGESSPVGADLDGDGVLEIVLGTPAGEVHALRGDGTELDGWPVQTGPDAALAALADSRAVQEGGLLPSYPESILATVAVGDLDLDGGPEVVAASTAGRVYAWNAQGILLPGFPVSILGRSTEELDADHTWDTSIGGAPTLADIDGDGDLEIVVAGMDQRLYVWHHDGTLLPPYPVEVCHPDLCGEKGFRILDSITVDDLDADGDPDFVFGTNEVVDGAWSVTYAMDARTATDLPGWPLLTSGLVFEASILPVIGEGHPSSTAVADVDGDGDLEILDTVMLGLARLLHHDGSEVLPLNYSQDVYGPEANTSESSFMVLASNPALGDMDGDGVADPVIGGSGIYAMLSLAMMKMVDFQHVAAAWSGADGAFLQGWPRQLEDFQFLLAPAIADLSGDGRPEAVFGSGGGVVYAWDAEGRQPPGFPHFTGQWSLGSPAVGDFDGDGFLDVVAVTREGWLFAWSTLGWADGPVEWASIHHDARNTGSHRTALPTQAGPVAATGCCGGGDSRAALLLLPVVLVGWRRRGRGAPA